ncbi:ModD protein [Tropicimonas sp. IMCC34043]|uniref:ModD protein n=1 Tax=Tropicimonas sp. IMCC34043 TaxID=2248760 RepID=UPI000E264573|nr:ModD protein [Tropicimonas sp. IMCC34043]
MFFTDDDTLARMLKEDLPNGDLTTRSLGIGLRDAYLTMRARNDMTVCASEEAARMFGLLGVETELLCSSGTEVAAGRPILTATGTADAIFAGWKVAQTLMEWASGVATSAARLVAAARAGNPATIVACTRKPVPGTRALSLKAVVAGGAAIHRTGLSDTVLLFPEHRAFGGPEGLGLQIDRLRRLCPERRIVVEVGSLEDALLAADRGADVVQLEKFAPGDVAATAAALGPDWPGTLAAAGGVSEANARDYAASGAHVLVTSSPYYARPSDVAVTIAAG